MKPEEKKSGRDPFKVPEYYFEEVNRKIISATAGDEPVAVKKGLYRTMRPWLAVAASVAVMALLGIGAVKLFLPESGESEFPRISLQKYPEPFINDIDIESLEEIAGSSLLSEETPDLTRSEIIDFLISENIDENEIYEFL